MPAETEVQSPTATQVIEREIERARVQLKPISRRSLRERLVHEQKLSPKEAEELVDAYCEERAPYTPDYLSDEFLLPYIKLAGLVFVIISLLTIGYGAHLWINSERSWPWFVIGAVLFTISGVGLVKALRYEGIHEE